VKKHLFTVLVILCSLVAKAQPGPTSFTLSPMPINGQYSTGTVVTMCFTMTGFGACPGPGVGGEWFEGFDLDLGPGWASVTPVTAPVNCGGGGGQWIWLNNITTAATPPVTAGPGYFFDNIVDGNSANDFGDAGNCTWSFCVNLTVANLPTAGNLSISVAAGADGYYGSWGGNNCDYATPVVVLPTTTTISGNPLCSVTATNTSPSANHCAGAAVTLTASNASGATNYQWSGPNGYSATGQSVTIPAAQMANAGVYTVTATGLATCTGSTTVVVNPSPQLNLSSNSPICTGTPLTLSSGLTATPGLTFIWQGPAGSGFFSIGGTANNANPTIANPTLANSGTYTVTAQYQNPSCIATQTISVVVTAGATVTTIPPITVCAGGVVPAQTFTGTPAAATFSWTNNNTSIGLAASGTAGFPSFTATNNTANPVVATVSVVANFGTCNSLVKTFTITVNPAPTITAPSSNVYCEGATVPAITWAASSPSATVAWTNNNTATGLGASGTGNIPSFTASAVTNQVVSTITATPSIGACVGAPITFNLTVSNAPPVTITDIGPLCSNAGFQTLVAATPGGVWSGPGIVNTSTGVFNPLIAGAGPHTISYTLSLPNQCPSTDDTQILIINVPVVNAGPNQSVCQGQTLNLNGSFTNSNTGSETFAWTPTTNLTGASTLTPTYTANSTQTYTLTVTSGICSATNNVLITMVPQTDATINPAGPFCAEDLPVVLTAAQPGGTWSGPGITNSSTGAFDAGSATGVLNTITYSIGGTCPSTDTQIIVVNSFPDGTIAPVGPLCQSDLPITLTSASPGGIWSGTGINNTSTGSFGSPTLPANTYTISYNTGGNCGQIFTQTIVVNASTDATINPVGPYCADAASVVLTAAQTGGTWSGTGITNTSTGAFNPASANNGPNLITYSIGGACPSSDTQSIVVNEVFDGTITPAGPFCQVDLPFTLNAASTGGTWTGTGINNSSTGSFGSASLAANSYVVTYTTAGACPRVFNQTIVVNANVDATISNVPPLCADVVPFDLTSVDPGGTWSGTGITDPINGTFDPSLVSNGTTITYSIPGACPSSDTQQITVYAVYDGTITPVGPFCQVDLPIVLTAASTGGTWSGTGINNAASGSFGSSSLPANTYTITYTPLGNCSQASTTTIVVNANVDATISPVADVCNNAPAFNLVAADGGGTWSGSTGISSSGTFTPSSVTPGPYAITYSIGGACPDTDTQSFNVIQVLDGTITPAGPFCQESLPVTLTAASTGGTWSGTGITSAANGTFGSPTTPANNYTITYTTPGQCSQVFNQVFQVIANLNPTIASVGPFCEDAAPVTLSAASPGGVWTGTAPITAGGQISPITLGAGTYIFNYDINNNGCLSSDNVQVVINALPVPSFSTSATTGCSPLSVTFTNTSNPLGSNCVWYLDGNAVGSGNTYTDLFQGNSCSDIGITVIDAAGCSASVTQNDVVCVVSNPSASFSWEPTEPASGTTVFFDNASLGGVTYNWTIDGMTYTTEDVTFQMPSNLGETFEACLDVIGAGGCMDAQCYTVSVSTTSYVYVPNSFTPDGDGHNDVFAPIVTGLTTTSRYSFSVYSRWGDLIFFTEDPNEVWTGDVNNGTHFAEDGAYVYELKIQFSPGEEPFKRMGTVVLVR
jgi:gliding motility-associated-like protein